MLQANNPVVIFATAGFKPFPDAVRKVHAEAGGLGGGLPVLAETMKVPPNQPKRCSDCGSSIQRLTGVLWFADAEDSKWTFALPFCPTCEPQLLRRSLETVH